MLIDDVPDSVDAQRIEGLGTSKNRNFEPRCRSSYVREKIVRVTKVLQHMAADK
jgi:hypothetical protein